STISDLGRRLDCQTRQDVRRSECFFSNGCPDQSNGQAGSRSKQAKDLNSCLEKSGTGSAAREACSRVITSPSASSHDKALAFASRAIGELDKDQHDEAGRAKADIAAAFALEPNLAEAYFAQGMKDYVLALGDASWIQTAIGDFDHALARNPTPGLAG